MLTGKNWMWIAPQRVERMAETIRFHGWRQYEPAKVPALWLRIADLKTDPDGWVEAVKQYGPLFGSFSEDARAERYERDPWVRAIGHLAAVSMMWKETAGIWELPSAPPVELTTAYRRLQNETTRVIVDDGVKLTLRGLDPVPVPTSLDAYLWLSVAAAVGLGQRYKKCGRCRSWFPIRRADAQFCSAVCRNWRDPSLPQAPGASVLRAVPATSTPELGWARR